MGMSQNATCNHSNAFPSGCKRLVTQFLEMIFHPVTVGVIIVLVIQVRNCQGYAVHKTESMILLLQIFII